MDNDKQFYKVSDLVRTLDTTKQTVALHIKKGRIEAFKFGREWRIPRHEFLRLIGQNPES